MTNLVTLLLIHPLGWAVVKGHLVVLAMLQATGLFLGLIEVLVLVRIVVILILVIHLKFLNSFLAEHHLLAEDKESQLIL